MLPQKMNTVMNTALPSPIEAAHAVAPLIREHAAEIERTRELPKTVFNAIADAGIFHLVVPRAIGGPELDYPSFVQVMEILGKADASTAWAVNQGATFGGFAARMAPHVARKIWIETPRSVVANTPGPSAKAIAVPGGYRVTGRQPFSTGCRHASWIAAHALIIEDGKVRERNGKPEARYLIMPVAQAEVLDTWHTRGMRGTGTNDFAVNDVFVSEEFTVFPRGGRQISGGVRYKVPPSLMFAGGDAAIALGVARSCLDAFFELAGGKTPRYVQGLLRDLPLAQFAVGQSEAALRAGRAYLMEAIDALWEELVAKEEASLENRVNLRLAATHAIRLAAKIVDDIYNASGATAVFESNLIQRHFQDIHVITQHLQGRLSHYETAGQYWMGLPIDDSRL